MSTIPFDTLAFANKLKHAGVHPNIAEVEAEAISEVLSALTKDQLVTKNDLRDAIQELEMRFYSFIIKTTVFTVSILGGLQTLFHFVK